MHLTNFEKETIILFNEAEDTAGIETFNARLLGQLRKVENCEGVICQEREKGYGFYIVPKTMIKIHAPHKNVMTDEQRAEKSKLMKAMHEERRKINSKPL